MSNVLVINGNLHGHINPTFPLVKELVDRGEEVWYFCAAAFAEKVSASGAHLIPSGESMENFYNHYRPTGNHPFFAIIEYVIKMDRELVPAVLEKTKGMAFDYIIHDAMLGGGRLIGKRMGLPTICSCSSFAMNKLPVPDRMLQRGFHPQLDEYYTVLENVCKEWKIPVPDVLDVFFKKGDLNLVYTSKEFHPDADSFDDTFRFVGPSIRERDAQDNFPFGRLDGRKLIYISLGTINTKFNDFYKKCMEAFADSDFQVVMSVGTKTSLDDFDRIPDNFIVQNEVPQLEILKKASLFISHSGMNSVSESLYYGVPVLSIPLVNDQYLVSRQLTGAGAGIALKMEEITAGSLRESVSRMLSDNRFAQASRRIGESFRAAGGYKTAADCIFDFKTANGIR